MANPSDFPPSRRGLQNLKPMLMFDLQRIVEKFPAYDADTTPDGLIDIGSSINVLMQPEALKYSRRYILPSAEQSLQYGSTAGSPKLLAGIAQYVNNHFHPSVRILPSQIMATNGVSALISTLVFNLCEAGEGVMYPVPEYGMFAHDIRAQNEVKIVEVTMTTVEDRFQADNSELVLEEFRSACRKAAERGIKVRAILLSNPCNPLGRTYSRSTLVAIAKFCALEGMHFISDEIYAMSSISRSATNLDSFTSVLSLREDEGVSLQNIHCLSGASKDFGMGGLRLGWLVTRNDVLKQTVRKLGAFTWVNAFADNFFGHFLADQVRVSRFLALYQRRLEAAHNQATEFLSNHDIAYNVSNSGVFLWVDLSLWLRFFPENDSDSPELLLTYYLMSKGVYLEPGEAFSSPVAGRFRLVYTAANSRTLAIALRRLVQSLEDLRESTFPETSSIDGDSGFEKMCWQIKEPPRRLFSSLTGCFFGGSDGLEESDELQEHEEA
ncbi:pyridoxal phosphate-dependent transferase [Leptodontidium sp. MPI-SDFR-AT-0119]|nr:pyridoxal phosphate-dependent transferase [Leptodontidium sp. MPI-SDFR-AT-0119]